MLVYTQAQTLSLQTIIPTGNSLEQWGQCEIVMENPFGAAQHLAPGNCHKHQA